MKWTPNPQAVVQRLGDSMVLVNLESDRILELNETAARLFELVSSGLSEEEIVQRLAEEFEVEPQEALREVNGVLAELEQEQIVEGYAT